MTFFERLIKKIYHNATRQHLEQRILTFTTARIALKLLFHYLLKLKMTHSSSVGSNIM